MPKRDESANNVVPNTAGITDGKTSVSYRMSYTKNLGNFESIKIEVGVEIPLEIDDSTLTKVSDLLVVAKKVVVDRLDSDLKDIEK